MAAAEERRGAARQRRRRVGTVVGDGGEYDGGDSGAAEG